MTISVTLGGGVASIDREVFELLFDNSTVRNYKDYTTALSAGVIAFKDLLDLSRKAEIPYPLFFAPLPVVTAQVDLKTRKLLQGVRKGTFSLNSRATIELADVELIIKDLVRKQELVKKHDPTLKRNPIVGMLRKSTGGPVRDAQALLTALGFSTQDIQATKNKTAAAELFISRLEANHILVSRSVNGYMPQTLSKAKFSGLTVRDGKVPYIFLTGGSHGEDEEPVGRQVFTLALLAVLVARRVFVPVTMDTRQIEASPGPEYGIVAEMLMPAVQLRQCSLSSLDEVGEVADHFKVTPSAIVVRSALLKLLDRSVADDYLAELAKAYSARPKPPARTPKPVNAIRKYNGREFSVRMLDALDSGRITPREFCQLACSNRIGVFDIPDFRSAVW
ncbi:hypothetical protein [Helcobacillus massiliensis]|uniref:Uncharacterized protein n=1 Tax=Helcobacillus massiliensis TaxID=521392 RepID=A0A839QTE4_9MICO|nr:hypothetical protein [Helcobacillus massiliensis]MBB3022030.1 hypothetical protein [Helcobacillus massiliensis]